MADLSARRGKAIRLVADECLLEKVDEVGRALDDEVRRERVVALRDRLDGHDGLLVRLKRRRPITTSARWRAACVTFARSPLQTMRTRSARRRSRLANADSPAHQHVVPGRPTPSSCLPPTIRPLS